MKEPFANINFQVLKEEKEALKKFYKSKGLSLSCGIRLAIKKQILDFKHPLGDKTVYRPIDPVLERF